MKKIWKLAGTMAFWFGWYALKVQLARSKRTRVVIENDGYVLLVKAWLGPDHWSLPGGGLKRNEDPRDCAVREIKEETGLVTTKSKLQEIGEFQGQERGLKFEYIGYKLIVDSRVIKTSSKSVEITEARWFKISELDKLNLASATRQLIASCQIIK